MKKFYITSAFVLCICAAALSQAPNPSWVARYDGPAGKFDGARDMVVKDGFVYVTGSSEHRTSSGDYVAIKYTLEGKEVWTARYNGVGNGDDWPYAIAVDNEGNVYLTGRSTGAETGYDIATVKFSSSGALAWVKHYNGTADQNDYGKDVTVDDQGNVYVTGTANGESLSGFCIVTIRYGNDNTTTVMKYDQLPDLAVSGAPNTEEGNSLAIDSDGNIYVTGKSNGGILIKYSADGGEQWSRQFGGMYGRKVVMDPAQNILVTGWGGHTAKYNPDGDQLWLSVCSADINAAHQDMVLDADGNAYITGYGRPAGSEKEDYLTVKYNGVDGSLVWSKVFGGSGKGIDLAQSIALYASGEQTAVYVTGRVEVKNGKSNLVKYGTVKYGPNGEEVWSSLYIGKENKAASAYAVAVDHAGGVYVTGQNGVKPGNEDIMTIKYSEAVSTSMVRKTSVSQMPSDLQIVNYPNPFRSETIIEYSLPKDGNLRLSVLDLSGREVATLIYTYQKAGRYQHRFQAGKIAAGTYWYRLQFGETVISKRMMVLR